MRFLRAVPLAVVVLLVLLGVAGLVACPITFMVTGGHFLNSGQRVTVPASVELTLDPTHEHTIFHERTGSHITVNQPLTALPDDLTVTLTDADTGAPVPTAPASEQLFVTFFDLHDLRHGFATFTPPPSGRVRFNAAGSFTTPQVFYVGPSSSVYMKTTLPLIRLGMIASMLALLLAGVCVIARLMRPIANALPDD